MLAGVNAVANGGVWVQPHAVDAIINPNTATTTPFVPVTRRVMSATAAATLAHMMVGVVNDPGAEGKRARISGYSMEIAGKTGTAQVALPNGGGYGPNVVASFVGFMPAHEPAVHDDGHPEQPAGGGRATGSAPSSRRRSGSRWPR